VRVILDITGNFLLNRLISKTAESKTNGIIQCSLRDGCCFFSLPAIPRTFSEQQYKQILEGTLFLYSFHRHHTTLTMAVHYRILDIKQCMLRQPDHFLSQSPLKNCPEMKFCIWYWKKFSQASNGV